MKFLAHLAAGASFMVAAPASASDWWIIDSKGAGNFFVDVTSINQVGTTRTAWIHIEDVGGITPKIQYIRARVRFDCAERSAQFMTVVTYDADGNQLKSAENSASPKFPAPESSEWDTLEFVCSYAPGKFSGEKYGEPLRISPNHTPSEFVAIIKATREDLERTNSPLLKRRRP